MYPQNTPYTSRGARAFFSTLLFATIAGYSLAQQTPATTSSTTDSAAKGKEEDVIVLSPFEVSSDTADKGYSASTTLAGNRLNTELRDIGNAVSVINGQ